MIFPCCKQELPVPLGGVEKVTCLRCNQSYLPSIIIDYNEMVDVITDWRDVTNGKAQIIAEPGEASFIAELMRRGLKFCI